MSLKDRLKKLIETKGEISFGELATFTAEEGYRVSNMERRMRELCSEGHAHAIMGLSRRKTEYITGWSFKKPAPKPIKKYTFEGNKVIVTLEQPKV